MKKIFRPHAMISKDTWSNATCDLLYKCKYSQNTWNSYPCNRCRRNLHLRTHYRRDCDDKFVEA